MEGAGPNGTRVVGESRLAGGPKRGWDCDLIAHEQRSGSRDFSMREALLPEDLI
jgi:hypothetical protein